MGPPKHSVKKRKQKREYNEHSSQSHSMPTTPNLESRHNRGSDVGSDSDSNYGFNENWGA